MMSPSSTSPSVKRLVLIGGGHSHLGVLMWLGMNPVPGLDVTLVTRETQTPYSGALPACIDGAYDPEDILIDLRPLAHFAGARIIRDTVSELDLENRHVLLNGRPPLRFDALSLNIGSRPSAEGIDGADTHALGIKPIDRLLSRWPLIKRQAVACVSVQQPWTLAIVGGGPASVEFAFSAQRAINNAAGVKNSTESSLVVRIITADSQILKFHNSKVRDFTRTELERRKIQLHFDHVVTGFEANRVVSDGRGPIDADCIIYATGAGLPHWPGKAGLALDEGGFIAVDTTLQSVSHPFVFASGDAAGIEGHSRPKSGVFAVRQGKPLAQNLIRFLTGRRLKQHVPQKLALALIYIGDRRAIASRGSLFLHGRSVWLLKHRIDRRFLSKYANLPGPETALTLTRGLTDARSEQELREHALRCAGCAAKVGSASLSEALRSLRPVGKANLLSGPGQCEDAAVIRLDDDSTLVQSVDYFRSFVNDPWLFARIAANHCLNDIYATGALPHSALAIASVPFASQRIMTETLEELMSGCVATLNEHDTALAGGHSNEAGELAFGLTVNGFSRGRLLGKRGAQPGHVLILTKPLGTGTLLAADMRLRAQGRWMDRAFEQMLVSNRAAAACFLDHEASACTDITGFGLAGHLAEMLAPDALIAQLQLDALPVLEGARETLRREIFSSLHNDNRLAATLIEATRDQAGSLAFELLFDPQTAGGLLGCVPAERADACVRSLRTAGYTQAGPIGTILGAGVDAQIRLTD